MTSSDGGAAAMPWEPPALAPTQPQPRQSSAAPAADTSAAELARLRDEAREAGYAEGLAAGRARVEAMTQELGQLVEALAHPFRNSDTALVRSLVDLVEHVVRAVLQRELQAGLDLEPVLRDALAALDESAERIELLVNPADKAQLDSIGADLEASVIADPAVEPGGLVLRSGPGIVDATLEARLAEAMVSLRDSAGVPGAEDTGNAGADYTYDPRRC